MRPRTLRDFSTVTDKSSARNSSYSVTAMRNGSYRAECFIDGCHWWLDFETEQPALALLRDHMRLSHQIGVRTNVARSS